MDASSLVLCRYEKDFFFLIHIKRMYIEFMYSCLEVSLLCALLLIPLGKRNMEYSLVLLRLGMTVLKFCLIKYLIFTYMIMDPPTSYHKFFFFFFFFFHN